MVAFMTVEQAIARRASRRSYLPDPLTDEHQAALRARMAQLARAGAVRIELVGDGGQAFSHFGKSYGFFSGVRSFFALIGREDDPDAGEKLGYLGELLVLEACGLGVDTCWVGGTYDAGVCPCTLAAGEKLFCVITVGYSVQKRGLKEALIYRMIHRGTKDLEELYEARGPVPAWFMEGMQAVRRAPSALNRQAVKFRYERGRVCAEVPSLSNFYDLDLGIAKAHFALPAGGCWQWGNGGCFQKQTYGQYGITISAAIDVLLQLQLGTDKTR